MLKLRQGKIPTSKCGGDTRLLMSKSPLRLFFTGDGAWCSVCHVFALPSNNPFTLCSSKSHQFPARLEHNQLLCLQAVELNSQDNNPACAVRDNFWYISLLPLHDYGVELPDFTFYGELNLYIYIYIYIYIYKPNCNNVVVEKSKKQKAK